MGLMFVACDARLLPARRSTRMTPFLATQLWVGPADAAEVIRQAHLAMPGYTQANSHQVSKQTL